MNRNRNIYGGIEASDIVIDIAEDGDEEKDADTRRVKYTVTMQTLAGELSFDNMVAIFNKDEEGSYKMEWGQPGYFPNPPKFRHSAGGDYRREAGKYL